MTLLARHTRCRALPLNMSQLSTFYPENVTSLKGTTGTTTDNSVLRADGVGGSTAQASDLAIEDAATAPQNNVAITNQHSGQTNSALVLCNKGTGAFIVSSARPDATSIGGNSRGASSVCIIPTRNNANQVASGANAVAIGGQTRAGGSQGVAIGFGSTDGASNNCVAIGSGANAGGVEAISIGYGAIANATQAISIGQSTAGATYAIALGIGATASLRAQFNCRPFSVIYWGGTTTDATANVELFLDASSPNRLTVANNTALVADILIIGNSTASSKSYWASRRVAIRKDTGNVALIGAVEGTESGSTASTPWSFTIDADTTNQALRIRVTGEPSTSITWRATAFYRVV